MLRGAKIDGLLSLFAGGSLLLMIHIGRAFHAVEFLQYIGDALVVLIFEITMIKEPIHIIHQNFVELAGGQLQSKQEREQIIRLIDRVPVSDFVIEEVYISRTGSLLLILLYINGKMLDPEHINSNYRHILQNELRTVYPNATVEIFI